MDLPSIENGAEKRDAEREGYLRGMIATIISPMPCSFFYMDHVTIHVKSVCPFDGILLAALFSFFFFTSFLQTKRFQVVLQKQQKVT